jgi:hypothetical protein
MTPTPGIVMSRLAANRHLRRTIMDENGGGAGRFIRASQRAIVRG